MAATPLTNYFSAKTRELIYKGYALVGVLIGSVQVAFASIEGMAVPDFMKVVLAVYAYLGVALGFVAASNVNPTPVRPNDAVVVTPPGEDGIQDVQGRHERGV